MKTLLYRFLQTPASWVQVIARLTVAVVFFPHGAQKVLGWFGGPGFGGAIEAFASLHVPAFLAVLAIAAEFLGSLGLFVGLGTRLAALGITINMFVAVAMVHLQNGFFMNWQNDQKGEGAEYHILVVGLCLIILITGAGRFSLDRLLASRLAVEPDGTPMPRRATSLS